MVTRENEGEMRARESEHPYTPTHKGMLVIEGAAVHSGCPKFHSVRVYRTDAISMGRQDIIAGGRTAWPRGQGLAHIDGKRSCERKRGRSWDARQ